MCYVIVMLNCNDNTCRKGQQVHQISRIPLQLHLLFELIKILIVVATQLYGKVDARICYFFFSFVFM